ncbi:hypothetical protein P43SY_004849 [Pythium insidiosum]|uniref:F-box domain-containing protein n=1 Tax=Pythium insidiosum TaxID=114742 RepID=A0AAD5M6I9_PYTIN|nr:hypothetical protein P43SY_004849 [Pythium insidiosum]
MYVLPSRPESSGVWRSWPRRWRRSQLELVRPVRHGLNVDSLPDDVVERLMEMLDHASMHRLELCCRGAREAMQRTTCWREATTRRVASYADTLSITASHKLWKQLSCALRRRATQLDTVFSDATDGLNHDRNLASISPARLLVPSRCWHWIQRLLGHDRQRTDDAAMDRLVRQRHCGCGYYVPCFWASPSSASASAVTSIEFYVAASCFLSTISVVPYQAFWAPGAPCFAPRRIAVSFHRRDDKQCDCEYYRSPEYVVTNEMTLQRIVLPKLVWVTPQCRVQLHLIDRHTAVPSDVSLPKVFQPTASGAPSSCGTAHFFCCLSFVGASGLVPVTTPTRCPARRWWQPSY